MKAPTVTQLPVLLTQFKEGVSTPVVRAPDAPAAPLPDAPIDASRTIDLGGLRLKITALLRRLGMSSDVPVVDPARTGPTAAANIERLIGKVKSSLNQHAIALRQAAKDDIAAGKEGAARARGREHVDPHNNHVLLDAAIERICDAGVNKEALPELMASVVLAHFRRGEFESADSTRDAFESRGLHRLDPIEYADARRQGARALMAAIEASPQPSAEVDDPNIRWIRGVAETDTKLKPGTETPELMEEYQAFMQRIALKAIAAAKGAAEPGRAADGFEPFMTLYRIPDDLRGGAERVAFRGTVDDAKRAIAAPSITVEQASEAIRQLQEATNREPERGGITNKEYTKLMQSAALLHILGSRELYELFAKEGSNGGRTPISRAQKREAIDAQTEGLLTKMSKGLAITVSNLNLLDKVWTKTLKAFSPDELNSFLAEAMNHLKYDRGTRAELETQEKRRSWLRNPLSREVPVAPDDRLKYMEYWYPEAAKKMAPSKPCKYEAVDLGDLLLRDFGNDTVTLLARLMHEWLPMRPSIGDVTRVAESMKANLVTKAWRNAHEELASLPSRQLNTYVDTLAAKVKKMMTGNDEFRIV